MFPKALPSVVIPACLLAFLTAVPSPCRGEDAASILSKMQSALLSDRTSTRVVDIVISSGDGANVVWTAWEARKTAPDGRRMLTVLRAPETVESVALLAHETAGGPDLQWMYVPAVRRVRKVVYQGRHQAFLGTDFMLSDLGFAEPAAADLTLIGEERIGEQEAWQVREIPSEPGGPYSSIVTRVAKDTYLPLRREYYDSGARLWKVQTFDDVTVIDGTPTVLEMRMDDLQEGGSTTVHVREVRYDGEVADATFDPTTLAATATELGW